MATARERRAATRAALRAQREGRRALPSNVTSRARKAGREYAQSVLEGRQPYPSPGTPESRQLARWGSYARWGTHGAPPEMQAAFQQYWYRDKNRSEINDADIEDEADYEDEEEE